ncbi:unnamed protein product [Heterobilharzia americana]|nr:unnamed protein product [Heterobilharzia americana]
MDRNSVYPPSLLHSNSTDSRSLSIPGSLSRFLHEKTHTLRSKTSDDSAYSSPHHQHVKPFNHHELNDNNESIRRKKLSFSPTHSNSRNSESSHHSNYEKQMFNYHNYQAELTYHLQKHFSLQSNQLNIYQNIPNWLQTDIHACNDNTRIPVTSDYPQVNRQVCQPSTSSLSFPNAPHSDYNGYQQHERHNHYPLYYEPNSSVHNNISLNPSDVSVKYFPPVNDHHSNPLITSLGNSNNHDNQDVYYMPPLYRQQQRRGQQSHFIHSSESNPKPVLTSSTQSSNGKILWNTPYISPPSSNSEIQQNLHSNKIFPLMEQQHQNYGSNHQIDKLTFVSESELLDRNRFLSRLDIDQNS